MNADLSIISHNRTLAFAKHAKMGQNEPFFALISYRTWHNMAKGIAMCLLNQYILCLLSSYCPSPVLVLSKPWPCIVRVLSSYCLTSHVVFFICLCCDKNTLLQTKLSPILPVSQIFSLYLQHRFATTAVVRNDFIEKVLLKLSSKVKLRNFD